MQHGRGDRQGWASCSYITQLNENVTDIRRVSIVVFFPPSLLIHTIIAVQTLRCVSMLHNHDSAVHYELFVLQF